MTLRESLRSARLSSRWKVASLLVVGLMALGGCEGASSEDAGAPDGGDRPAADSGCAGELDCACRDDDTCTRGQCVEGICKLCTAGTEDCVCGPLGTCGSGLACTESNLCKPCVAGELGCDCVAGICGAGLQCEEGLCVEDACPPGTLDCACRTNSVPRCDTGMVCLPDETCHVCNGDAEGCACVDGACSNGLLCDGDCRAPRSCAVLVAEGRCGANQLCNDVSGGDGQCIPDTCQPGFVLFGNQCVPGAPNCLDGEPGSVLATCSARFRQCEQGQDANGTSTAACGACLGNAQEIDGECVGRLQCGQTYCQEEEYCDVTGQTPRCKALPCAAGAALNSLGVCQSCGFNCQGPGLTGRVWPFRSADSSCVCETEPGYFLQAGGSTTAELCDLDGDGWVREETIDPALLIDGALVANARCGVSSVDRVRLRDEFGVSKDVVSCLEGLLINPAPSECTSKVPLPLVETLRNDTPGPLLPTFQTPAFGLRQLFAKEVNGLAKACVDGGADYNDNQQTDLTEVQADPIIFNNDPNSGRARLQSFSYFMETHRAYVETVDGVPALVIEERRRCDSRDFPLHLASNAGPGSTEGHYDRNIPSTYWRSCQRGVDPAYDVFAPAPGHDFAQWSCPDGVNCQPIPAAPPYRRSLLQPTPVGFAPPDDATACEMGSYLPGDGIWRGMHHASQFKCVRASDAGGLATRPLAAFVGPEALTLNRCSSRFCIPGDGACVASRKVVPGSPGVEPIIDCTKVSNVLSGDVGFAIEPYKTYGAGFGGGPYEGGCINEDEEFRDTLCPAPVTDTDPNWNINPPSAAAGFGRSTCFIGPCPQGRADCDSEPLNGCEVDATRNESCGGCPTDPLAKCLPEDPAFTGPKHATAECDDFGFCQIIACEQDYEDCDGILANGCETPTTTNDNCGGCGVECAPAGGTGNCSTGVCTVGSCEVGLKDCDADPTTGCETVVSTIARCGGCSASACFAQNGTPSCVLDDTNENYECGIDACAPGFEDCNLNPDDGCEAVLAADADNCGACGNECNPNQNNGEYRNTVRTCLNGTCGFVSCEAGFGDCDNDPGTGCEVRHFADDSDNCRFCGDSCSALEDTANVACTQNGCELGTCLAGRANCNARDNDGCEVNLAGTQTCGAATDVGSEVADTQCGVICTVDTTETNFHSTTARGAKWFKARALDDIGVCSEPLQHKVRMTVPANINYDLYVWDACGGNLIASSTSGGIGESETVTIRRDDGTTADKSFNYWVEVRWVEGTSCEEYDLTFIGRVKC